MRRRLAKRRMLKRTAGIMKIHSYSTSPAHEEVNTRKANSSSSSSSRKAPQPNGVDSAERRHDQLRQLRPAKTLRNTSAGKTTPRIPELDNIVNRRAVRRTQQEEDDRISESVLEEPQGEAEEEDQSLAGARAAKRPRRVFQAKGVAAPLVGIKQEKVTTVDEHEHEPVESTVEFDHLTTGGTERQLHAEEVQEDEEDEEEEEEDGTSSSTASAEEEIGEEMDPQQPSQKGGSRASIVTAASRAQLSRGAGTVERRGTTTTILMTEEDYEQHQQEQQQADDEDAAMDEYEGTVGGGAVGAPGGSEDMEDTDGALTGNRLFRKKVKRKVHARTNSASASGSLGIGGGTNSITSSKGKLQMLQEFPTLFIGLRRNRLFLVNALAQSFDLNQRDIVLTLRKIKQNESSARLANFFGIGAADVDLLFHTSVPKIADCLRNFIVWPDDFTMKLNVPVSLRQHFNRIHLILNYLVLRVKQNAVQQLPPGEVGLAYCPVDQCHKLKYLVASTLDGCVCFVSRAFGVQTDDEQLLAQSGFLTKFKTNTNLIAGQNFHNFEDRLANGHDHTNNNGGGGRNRRTRANDDDDSDLERVLGNCDEDNFEDIVSEKISKSRTFKLKNYIENILENFQNHQMLSPHTCIDGRTFKLLDDIVVIVGALINLQKQEID